MAADARRDAPTPQEPWAYLEAEAAPDAPLCDNPSGLYCSVCRAIGLFHCSAPEYCGEMRRMRSDVTR